MGHNPPILELLTDNEFLGAESDEAIFEASLDQPQRFKEILLRYQEAFLRKARSILRSEEEAEDAVQETFTKIYLKASSFTPQGEGSFKSWGYRILMNTCFTRYQQAKRRGLVSISEEMEAILPDLGVEGERAGKELADYVASVFTRMPEEAARLLVRFYLDGKSGAEIAAEDGVSVGAVKTRMYRAKELFREAEKRMNKRDVLLARQL